MGGKPMVQWFAPTCFETAPVFRNTQHLISINASYNKIRNTQHLISYSILYKGIHISYRGIARNAGVGIPVYPNVYIHIYIYIYGTPPFYMNP